MLILRILALVCLSFFPLSIAFAHHDSDDSYHRLSIQSMFLSYNSLSKVLHVEADHHARDEEDREVDYVSKMTVSVNGDEKITLHFMHQSDPDMFSDDALLKAKSGDVIMVELFSESGSDKSLNLTVSDEIITETRSVQTEGSETQGFESHY